MNTKVQEQLAKDARYRLATYLETDYATHAVCDCGIIAPINETHHICAWTRLVPIKKKKG